MDRRHLLRAVGTALGTAGLAGCLGGTAGSGAGTPSGTDTTTDPGDDGTTPGDPDGETPTPPDPTATPDDPPADYGGEQEADPDLPVMGANRHDAAHTVGLTVSRAGTAVHEATHELAPGRERELYNLRAADPDGIERFTVTATLGGRTESVDVLTSDCYGRVIVAIRDDGVLDPTYTVC